MAAVGVHLAQAGAGVRSSTGTELDFSREKAERMLGWTPKVSVEEGLRRLIDWRKTQPA